MMLNLIGHFKELGYPITLLLAKKEGTYLEIVPDNLVIVDLNKDGLLGPVLPLRRWIKDNKPDVVLSCLTIPNLTLMLVKLLLPAGSARFVISPRSIYDEDKALCPPHKAWLKYGLVKLLYGRADALICISDVVRQNLLDHYNVPPHKAVTIYNPAFSENIAALVQEPCDHPWLKKKDRPVIFTMGRLTTQKGFDILIEAFALLREKIPARLIILGEGEDRSMLQGLIEKLALHDDVDLAGFYTNPFSFMGKSDLFVLSSRYEGFGNVIIEALGCGLPVVATNSGSAYEILGDQKWGSIVSNKNSKEMAGALAEMLERPYPSVDSRRKRARDFSVETIAKQYLGVLEQGVKARECSNVS